MSNARYQYEYRKSASKRHKIVGEILRTHPYFQNYLSFQEYPLEKIDPSFPSGRLMIDWVVPEIKLAIEVQGEAHYAPVRFGGISLEEAQEAFSGQQRRDRAKENACSDAGWTIIQISPKIDITADWLLEEYQKNFNPEKPQKDNTPNEKEEEYNKKKKAKAKEIRKAQYQKQKEWKKKNGV